MKRYNCSLIYTQTYWEQVWMRTIASFNLFLSSSTSIIIAWDSSTFPLSPKKDSVHVCNNVHTQVTPYKQEFNTTHISGAGRDCIGDRLCVHCSVSDHRTAILYSQAFKCTKSPSFQCTMVFTWKCSMGIN